MSELHEIPERLRHTCDKCGFAVAWVTTSRKSKGDYVEIEIDAASDTGEGGTVIAQVHEAKLYGNPVTKATAAAMRAAGRPLYGEHKMTCTKRNGTHKR